MAPFSGDANTNFGIAMYLLQDHMSKIYKNYIGETVG
jgi:hypothetical protein